MAPAPAQKKPRPAWGVPPHTPHTKTGAPWSEPGSEQTLVGDDRGRLGLADPARVPPAGVLRGAETRQIGPQSVLGKFFEKRRPGGRIPGEDLVDHLFAGEAVEVRGRGAWVFVNGLGSDFFTRCCVVFTTGCNTHGCDA